MPVETVEEMEERWAAEKLVRRTRIYLLLTAAISLCGFSYFLSLQVMTYERHVLATRQWDSDQRRLAGEYSLLRMGAVEQNDLAYKFALSSAEDEQQALFADALAMPTRSRPEKMNFLQQTRKCFPGSATAFRGQSPEIYIACSDLLK